MRIFWRFFGWFSFLAVLMYGAAVVLLVLIVAANSIIIIAAMIAGTLRQYRNQQNQGCYSAARLTSGYQARKLSLFEENSRQSRDSARLVEST